jgi:hypothetical protein
MRQREDGPPWLKIEKGGGEEDGIQLFFFLHPYVGN